MAAELAEAAVFLAAVRIFKTIHWMVINLTRENKSGHCAGSSWSELPWDILDRILQRLELPDALAVAAVCTSWRSAAEVSGVPRSGTPWLVKRKSECRSSEFRNLFNTDKIYMVSLPQGRRQLAWCGASHGWLIASDELSNLLLCNPFTFAMIPLPPITELGCIKGVYDDDGSIVGYHDGNSDELICCHPDRLGCWFYQKVVLSCDGGGDYIAMAICGNNQVSFAKARESSWRLASEMPLRKTRTPSERDEVLYADCVFHNGRFYTVTMGGVVEAWDPAHEPKKQAIIADGDRGFMRILTRFLVSTPWGGLLQIRTKRRTDHPRRIKVEVLEVDVEERKLVRLKSATAFRGHAVFVGLNESACLHAKEYPELRPNCVYFTTPWLTQEENFGLEGWSGVVIYDLESQTFEEVLPSSEQFQFCPWQVWFIPNI